MADVLIRVDSGTEAQTRALYRALRQDSELRQAAKLSMYEASPPSLDELGPTLDAVLAVVNGSAALGALLVSVASWRDGRATSWTISFEKDGVRVELQGGSWEELQRVRRELEGPQSDDG